MMFRWIDKQLRIQKFGKLFIHYQDIHGYPHDNKTESEFNSNTKVYLGENDYGNSRSSQIFALLRHYT